MSRRYITIPIAAVLTTSLAVSTTAASAATTWTVRPGGALTVNSDQVRLTDTKTGSEVRCPATLKATLTSGTGLPGTGIGSISSFTFGMCAGPVGLKFIVKTSHLPFGLNARSYNSGTGTTTASIIGIHGTFTGPGCSFVLDGTGGGMDNGALAVTYTNSTHMLMFRKSGSGLHAYRVSGCSTVGGINNDDPLSLTGTGTVTPSQTITSP
jgi:hypothetical protein